MLVVLAARLMDVIYFNYTKEVNQPFNANSFLKRFSVGCIATAISWSCYALWFHKSSSTVEITTTIAILSAFAGGSANLLSGSRVTSMCYSIILLMPYSIVLTLSDDYYHYVLGFLGITFSAIMVASSYKSATFTQTA